MFRKNHQPAIVFQPGTCSFCAPVCAKMDRNVMAEDLVKHFLGVSERGKRREKGAAEIT